MSKITMNASKQAGRKWTGRSSVVIMMMALLAVILQIGMMPANVFAGSSVSYVERSWNGSKVVETTKTANCTPVSDVDEDEFSSGWYYVDADKTYSSRERLEISGTVNIVLTDGKKLTCNDGINVPSGSTLNIYGQSGGTGELVAKGDTNYCAAIGGDDGQSCGTVNIHGGKVTADAKNDGEGLEAAGIGGGEEGGGGTVNIYGGTVNATGTNYAAGIGAGDCDDNGKDGGTVKIYGGNVTAQGGCDAAGIGGGEGASGGNVEIWGGTVNATGGTNNGSDSGAGIGSGDKDGNNVNAGTARIHGGTVTAKGGPDAAGIGGGNEISGGTIVIDGGTVNATGGIWGAGIGGGENGTAGNVTIRGANTIVTATGSKWGAGIGGGNKGAGGTINVEGGKKIIATGGAGGAGIGGGDTGAGGTIKISGGEEIEATGGDYGAGIGGGNDRVFDKIEITGGKIEAKGGEQAAGIGSGDRDSGTEGGTINISGGDVTATAGLYAAGIGGGEFCSGGTITISGGKVTATGGSCGNEWQSRGGGAGIGNGSYSNVNHTETNTITISGNCDVTATGGDLSAGIGGGKLGYYGDVTVNNGTVKATGGYYGAGIGSGQGYENKSIDIHGVDVTINDGDVTATGGDEGAGIGGGYKSPSGPITINDGTVKATGGDNGGAGIGSGVHSVGEKWTVDVTIKGGKITATAGEMKSKGLHGKSSWNYPGVAIGTSGAYYEHRFIPSEFRGHITLSGGKIWAYAAELSGDYPNDLINCRNVIGTSTEKNWGGKVSGSINFRGATVHMYPRIDGYGEESQVIQATNIYVDNIDHLENKFISGNKVSSRTQPSKDLTVEPKDGRLNRLTSKGNYEVVVEPCDHQGITIVDNGSDHSRTCKYCAYAAANEAHKYGDPIWTWGDNNASATAKFTCSVCKHVETVVDETVDTEEIQATGDDPAKTVYTAKVTLGGKDYTDTKEVPHGLANATITTAPEAKSVTYNGKEQALIKAGTATGGQMLYALGDDNGATGEFAATIPKGIDAGTYKVWYMVKGDSRHNDIPAARMDAEIGKAEFSKIGFAVNSEEAVYTGIPVQPEVSGTFNSGTDENPDNITIDASEYIVTYRSNTFAGTAYAHMESKGKNFGSGESDVEFNINKAKNNVTVSMDSWVKGESESTPQVTADFDAANATFKYKKKSADDSTYEDTAPSEIGEYTVKASIPGTANYNEGVATSNFEILQKKHNVTFDPNGGTGMKEAESVDDNSSYNLPSADIFGVPEGKCSFKAWEVKIGSADPVEKNPGESITVTADTTVKAVWNDDHAWGEPAYTWTDDNTAVTAKRVCGNNNDHEESETVKTTSKITTPATEQAEGKTTYTATFKNPAFETQTKEVKIPKLVKVTFIGSAIDDDRVGEPYTIGIPKGSSIKDVANDLEDEYVEYTKQFSKSEYAPYKDDIYATPKPLSSYDSWSALEEDDQWKTEITEDTELYFALWKAIDPINLKVEKPVCSADMATGPSVSVKEGSLVKISTNTNYPTQWWNKETGQAISSGQIEGGKSYTVKTYIRPEYGYFTDEGDTAPAVTVENADAKGITYNKVSGSLAMIMFDVTVDHDWNEASYKWSDDNSTVTATRICKRNKAHKETETVKATSKVTKQATIGAKGETSYTSAAFTNKAFAVQKKTEADIDKVDPAPLSNAIKAAKDAENGVKTSTDGKDVDAADKYTTPAEKKALDDAIAAAQKVANDPTSTQKQVDDAVAAVKKAKEAYDAAKKNGKKKSVKPTPTPKPDPTPKPAKVKGTLMAKMTAKAENKLAIRWTRFKGAAGYDIFFAKCNKKGKKTVCKKVKSIKGNKKFKWIKTGLKKRSDYKAYVRAYVKKNGKKKYVSKSPVMRAYTGNGTKKFTNAKSVKVKKAKVTLKKGKSFKIKAKVTKVKKGKKLMPKDHVATLRYRSTNKKVATVSKKGKIKAKSPGTCKIYVYAHNGVSKTINVTVK